jgi:hypothetical protein
VTRRLFYVALGATVGVLVVRKAGQVAQRYSPAGMSQGLSAAIGGLGEAIRGFTEEVRIGMAEREAELRTGLGIDGAPLPGDPA